MEKVTYFDVEYANNKNKSICQIGIMCENFSDGEPYFPERDIYINPEDGFDDFCIKHTDLLTAKSLEQIVSSINQQLVNIPEYEI